MIIFNGLRDSHVHDSLYLGSTVKLRWLKLATMVSVCVVGHSRYCISCAVVMDAFRRNPLHSMTKTFCVGDVRSKHLHKSQKSVALTADSATIKISKMLQSRVINSDMIFGNFIFYLKKKLFSFLDFTLVEYTFVARDISFFAPTFIILQASCRKLCKHIHTLQSLSTTSTIGKATSVFIFQQKNNNNNLTARLRGLGIIRLSWRVSNSLLTETEMECVWMALKQTSMCVAVHGHSIRYG